jgi:inosine/xanthosine triphosphatase
MVLFNVLLIIYSLFINTVYSLHSKMIIAVGSTNPVKINSARNGLSQGLQLEINPDSVIGFNVPSLVPDQPIGDKETKQGATNRAKAAYDACLLEKGKADYAVGLEGGIQILEDGDMECFAWMVVYDGKKFGCARTCSFNLPRAISSLIESGMELGDADDAVFGVKNNKQRGGTIGHLTRGVIDRTKYYEQAIILATIPFLHENLYP